MGRSLNGSDGCSATFSSGFCFCMNGRKEEMMEKDGGKSGSFAFQNDKARVI